MTATIPEAAKLTQKQIADQLGVSRQLVGFALRGEGRMSDEVRQRILEAARENGYHQYSNREARAMVSRRYGKRAATGVMAVMFQATFEEQPLSSVPFFVPFFHGLESEAIRRGVDLVLCPLRPNELPRLISQGMVDGVACLLTPEGTIEDLLKLNLPVVNVMPGGLNSVSRVPSLLLDSCQGTTLAVQHLQELGHQRIAYVGIGNPKREGGRESQARLNGYVSAMHASGMSPTAELMELSLSDPTVQAGEEGMRLLMRRTGGLSGPGADRSDPGFTGLVCFNDLIAMGAVRVLQSAGWRVPEQVSVVGFDDVSPQYSFAPALTSVRFPRHAMGERAVELLYELSHQPVESQPGENPSQTAALLREVFPVDLVIRDSTCPVQGKR